MKTEALVVVISLAQSNDPGSRVKTDAAYDSATGLRCGSRPNPPRAQPEDLSDAGSPGSSAGISWQQAAFLSTGVQLSSGLVLFQYPFGQQGYLWGTVTVLAMAALCCYTVSLLTRIKNTATPWVRSFQELALDVGGRAAKTVVGFMIELAWVTGAMMSFSLADTALQDALADMDVMTVTPVQCRLILAAGIWPIAQLQSLSGASWLSLGSTVGMLAAISMSIGSLVVHGQAQEQEYRDVAQAELLCDQDQAPGFDETASSLCSDYGIQAVLIYTPLLMVQVRIARCPICDSPIILHLCDLG